MNQKQGVIHALNTRTWENSEGKTFTFHKMVLKSYFTDQYGENHQEYIEFSYNPSVCPLLAEGMAISLQYTLTGRRAFKEDKEIIYNKVSAFDVQIINE